LANVPTLPVYFASRVEKNGICLDPFVGSGTTGMVCSHLDRRFIGRLANDQVLTLEFAEPLADTQPVLVIYGPPDFCTDLLTDMPWRNAANWVRPAVMKYARLSVPPYRIKAGNE